LDILSANDLTEIFDEAQHLSYSDFEWLRDIHDELELSGVCAVTDAHRPARIALKENAVPA
jgi:hypothetical protein